MAGDNPNLLLDMLSLRHQHSDVKEALGTQECVSCPIICAVYKAGEG